MKDEKGQKGRFERYSPSGKEVERLISRAAKHPLGLGFLREGDLGSVSAAFQVHAFVVEDARDKLQN